ncbi:MAG: sulfatase [Proteobacteria bacterium]|nr:sulfatase [Pseudomonadota bacterium]
MAAPIVLAIWVAALLPATAEAEQRPNVLLLMAEDLSPRIGAFGDAVAHTPNLDRLAEQGVRYTRAFTTSGVCAPSRAALMLGAHQISFGAQHMRTSGRDYLAVPPPGMKAFPELLRAGGYYTYTTSKLDYQFSGPLPTKGSGPFTIWDAAGLSGPDRDWRNRRDGQPFFGFVNFGVTHESGVFAPFGHWPHSTTHFVMQLARLFTAGPRPEDLPKTDPRKIVPEPYYPDTPTVRADIARHYDNIAAMDHQVGAVLAELEADGLADETIVIWTTDHGDGLPRAKRELYDSGIRVPMIVRWPERFRPPGAVPGSADDRLVSFVDLAPAILALAGLDAPESMQGVDFAAGGPAREAVFASRDRIDEVEDRQRAARDRRFKYILSQRPEREGGHPLEFRDNLAMMREMRGLLREGKLDAAQRRWFEPPGRERLFDLHADPHELRNVASDPAYRADLRRMRSLLAAWSERVPDWSGESEDAMRERLWPGAEQPLTSAPSFESGPEGLAIRSPTEGASIGYRIDDGDWRLYTAPVVVAEGAGVSAKAVRYGWRESEEARWP